jgi:hypothetical protein
MNGSGVEKCPVPHPFAFFLANGWETSNLNNPCLERARLYGLWERHSEMPEVSGHDFWPALSLSKGAVNTTESTRALKATEKLNRAVGWGFIPGMKPMESTKALAPEVCFSGILPEIQLFPQPV